jgi:glutaredoxin
MLFLLGLSCFAETVSLFADDGTTFVDEISMRAPASNEEMEGAAVYVVGKNGKIISTGRLRAEKQVQQVPQASVDFMEKKIPTQQWKKGEPVEVHQVEIFSTKGCRFCVDAQALADKVFGQENVKNYKIDGINPDYKAKSRAILKAVDQPNFPTVPRISVIGKNGVRYFLGGYDQLVVFVKSNKTSPIRPQVTEPQTVSVAKADLTDFSGKDIQTRKWNSEKVEPVQIEIFGTKACPYCVQAKALADRTFPEKTKEYNYNASDYAQRSERILNKAGIYNYEYIPRVSVIAIIDAKPVRFVLGGYSDFERFVNSMNRGQTRQINRANQSNMAAPSWKSRGIWSNW